jgi:YesN/AraC family two-component response regulator
MQLSVSVKQLKTYIPHSQIKAVDGLSEKLDFALEILTEQNDVTCDESRPYIQSLAASVYFLLAEHFADEDTYKSKNKERKLFFKTLDYVNANFTEPINVSIVARELFYPRSKLSAIFTKYSGARLGDYINGLRIQRVNELISSGLSITEAAFSSGFQNIRSFNNVYKEAMGVSPSKFIKMQ